MLDSNEKSKSGEIVIWWLRRDLRLNDNRALFHALKSGYPVLPLFIFDTLILDNLQDKKDLRVSFIYDTIAKLDDLLRQQGSSIRILNDSPINAFKQIVQEYTVNAVYTNADYEPYALERDNAVSNFLQEKSIGFHSYKDHVIFEKSEILKPDGTPYTIYTPYSRVWKQRYEAEKDRNYPSENFRSAFHKTIACSRPTLNSIGFEHAEVFYPELNPETEMLRHYSANRNFPSVEGTSRLGIHLRFGTVSIREVARLASGLSEQWLNELIWREFFIMILFHFPHVVYGSFKKKYDNIAWRNNPVEFEKWCRGETGYPLVDAGMRQLNETGWMHNRVRMVVASFLTKHLLIDWRWGEAYFAEKLLDYELASNNGNWQWAAGSGCDSAPYFRIFNPSEQIRKFDPELKYIKRWIPGFVPGYIQPIVEHGFARKRALEVYKNSLNE